MKAAADPGLAKLTRQQLAAITTPLERVFIEAEPGSGKTTVATARFGVLRFGTGAASTPRGDTRGVVALSFTRSATAELRTRVLQRWGRAALRRPHRIITIDTLICELVEHLLVTGAIRWPNGHTQLEVFDSWAVLADLTWSYGVRYLTISGTEVTIMARKASAQASRPAPGQVAAAINRGACTHDDVRAVLAAAISDPALRKLLIDRIKATTRAAIVDEVFDANELDLNVVRLLMVANLQVTLVGDPWQALYGFRGAKPKLVPKLVSRSQTTTLPLSATFRWKHDHQRKLADELRAGTPVTLHPGTIADTDVVLARHWKQLWSAPPSVLPIAIGSPNGTVPEAAATLLLSCLTRLVIGEEGPYVRDALSTLSLDPNVFAESAEGELHGILDTLCRPGTTALRNAYGELVDLLGPLGGASHPKVHGAYTKRLGLIQERLQFNGPLVPGMTAHQAKGREWDRVGICLAPEDVAALAAGLSSDEEPHRQLYVAGTRARYRTVAV